MPASSTDDRSGAKDRRRPIQVRFRDRRSSRSRLPRVSTRSTVRFISGKKGEPAWMLEWRLEAYRRWKTMTEPTWANVRYPKIDFQNLLLLCRAESRAKDQRAWPRSIPSCCAPTRSSAFRSRSARFWPACKGARVAVDAVFDSVSVVTTFKDELAKAGVIFCSISEAAARASRAGAQVSGLGGAAVGQLLCGPQLGGVLRRLVRLHP